MTKCTHKLGHFPDNQGLCHECGQPMSVDYLKAYRAGWNDALQELAIDGAEELKTRLWMFANRMKKK